MRMKNYTATMVEPTTAERLLEGAKRVGELAEKESHEAEVNATISQNVIDLIKETEISRILLPKEYGGPQVNLKTFSDIVRTVSNYNMSAGWLAYLYPLHKYYSGIFTKKYTG